MDPGKIAMVWLLPGCVLSGLCVIEHYKTGPYRHLWLFWVPLCLIAGPLLLAGMLAYNARR